ncbi:5'-methylthioadenosine/adenosylhomocysteine nucleosidase [Streptococcus zalophi]|uniref:adenosylhomocysteine nucleosidase n=1 Tax=Streptococcus zalophi TaxID=640031 RepID=A0A934UDH6_9STRE|nr:5'-methylthioadenosine/adenosylhomocysteine nucleosidase [Streptococcus zalophi]MBJ8349683.1 5'-methylthioadenosine/adenosylhomocysteine nucleosidase [Streptococcus zalophi]MCR8967968.1 5'-methylthioadenosine/adenosylhomocysteine nucleosidase [Streptococcus zalophi]
MKIGIIAAMAEEIHCLVNNLTEKKETLVLNQPYFSGKIGQHEVILVQSGIGKVMSAMSVAILADHFGVSVIINTGSAGAVAKDLKIGDVVVSDRLVYHDVDVTAFGYQYGQMAAQPLYYQSSPWLVKAFKKVLQDEAVSSKIGLIATGDSFIAGQEKIDNIIEHFPEVLAVEMEGASVAQAAFNAKCSFIVVRAISDTASHDANITFAEFIKKAGRTSAEILVTFLTQLTSENNGI